MDNTDPSQTQLPPFFKPIRWSSNFAALDPETYNQAIIVYTINYGDLAHWRRIIECYGKEAIRELLETLPATEFRPRARRLASIIFSLTLLHDAPRGTH